MFSTNKFNHLNNDNEEELQKEIKKYDLSEEENNNNNETNHNKEFKNSTKENNIDKKTVKKPNILRNKPFIKKNNSYNKSNDKKNEDLEESLEEDFIKEEDVVKIRNKPIINRKNNINNHFQKNKFSSSQDYNFLKEENEMAENGLPVRLDRLIDIVSDHQGLDAAKIKEIKKEALLNPNSLMNEYHQIFINEVKPNLDNRHKSLEDAKKENPDKIVFLFIKDGKQSFKALDKEKASDFISYDGLIIETISSSRTPFPPANILFEKKSHEIIEDNGSAFEENKENVNQGNAGQDSFQEAADLNSPPPSNSFKV